MNEGIKTIPTAAEKAVHKTAEVYADEFPGEPLDSEWSATAYQIDGGEALGLTWLEYHEWVAKQLIAKELEL